MQFTEHKNVFLHFPGLKIVQIKIPRFNKIRLQGRHLIIFVYCCNMTCRISCFQDGGSFKLNPLVTTCRKSS